MSRIWWGSTLKLQYAVCDSTHVQVPFFYPIQPNLRQQCNLDLSSEHFQNALMQSKKVLLAILLCFLKGNIRTLKKERLLFYLVLSGTLTCYLYPHLWVGGYKGCQSKGWVLFWSLKNKNKKKLNSMQHSYVIFLHSRFKVVGEIIFIWDIGEMYAFRAWLIQRCRKTDKLESDPNLQKYTKSGSSSVQPELHMKSWFGQIASEDTRKHNI